MILTSLFLFVLCCLVLCWVLGLQETKPSAIVTASQTVLQLDLSTMTSADQDFSTEFRLEALPGQPGGVVHVHTIVLWFDVQFSQRFCAKQPVTLTTSPFAPPTHWSQTLLHLKHPIPVSSSPAASAAAPAAPAAAATAPQAGFDAAAAAPASAPAVTGRISMCRNASRHRSLDISLEVSAALSDGSVIHDVLLYNMDVNN